jgi:Carboxypeptidase regulatory-like domain
MRRPWGLASILITVAASSVASAQPADVSPSATESEEAAPPQAIGYGAMPGGLHAPAAVTLPKGAVEVAMLGGFGQRGGLLGTDHKLNRGIGNIAIGFAPHELITIALSLDGRYDKHSPGSDDGYVGDPHLLVRAAKASGNLRFGGQLGIWVPGKDAPSVAGSAISVDARALLSLKAGPGLLSFSAGFRLDNSAKSADPMKLSVEDRVSLGVSEFHAVLAGASLSVPSGKLFFGAEASVDVFVGKGNTPAGSTTAHEAPGPLVRFGANAGYHITPEWAAIVFVEGAKVPHISPAELAANDVRLIAYEPTVTGGLGISGQFGGPKKSSNITSHDPVDITVVETADVSGEVVDETGKPVIGAKVEVKAKNNTGTAVTDDKGAFTVSKLPVGKTEKGVTTLDDTGVEVSVSVDGKKPYKTTMTLTKGTNAVAKVTLESVLPPGQLRGVIRSVVTGKPLPGATIKIEPGGKTATSAADGTFEVDLQPGTYKIKASAGGLADQELDVTIDPNGVAIKNIELHK